MLAKRNPPGAKKPGGSLASQSPISHFFFINSSISSQRSRNHPIYFFLSAIFEDRLGIVWHIAYAGTLFLLLGFWKTVIFILVHQALTGLHLALVFAPNHKGMPIFARETELDWFTKQVVTARNIYHHPLTNFMYGGLNFQTEHHLFPTMPRANYQKMQKITKQFCKEKGVDYYETGIIQSYKEVYRSLADVGEYARNLERPMTELQEQFSQMVLHLKEDLKELRQFTGFKNKSTLCLVVLGEFYLMKLLGGAGPGRHRVPSLFFFTGGQPPILL